MANDITNILAVDGDPIPKGDVGFVERTLVEPAGGAARDPAKLREDKEKINVRVEEDKKRTEEGLRQTRDALDEISSTQQINEILNKFYPTSEKMLLPEQFVEARKEVLERIRERPIAMIHKNYQQAIRALNEYYENGLGIQQQTPLEREKQAVKELDVKTQQFHDYYEQTVFNNIVHTSPVDLGESATLKSPALLAEERGTTINEAGVASGDLDELMENTSYVFANSKTLPSRSAALSDHVYRVDTQEGYVVPMDSADFHITDEQYRTIVSPGGEQEILWSSPLVGDPAVLSLDLYARNIYRIPEFKQMYARYNAILFASPQEAVAFYHKFGQAFWNGDPLRQIQQGRKLHSSNGEMTDEEFKTAVQMREIYNTYGIYPPFTPEFQFKDAVAAKQISKPKPIIRVGNSRDRKNRKWEISEE